MNRRRFLGAAACACALPGCRRTVPVAKLPEDERAAAPRTAAQALDELMAGNRRFQRMMHTHKHEGGDLRMALARGQQPFAVVVGCSDSRVPPEIVFDQGLGELFVIREIGHVIDVATLASVEYAVGHLHTPLVLVLGHEGCGAVKAAIAAARHMEKLDGHIERLTRKIHPAIVKSGPDLDGAVRANIRHAVAQLRTSAPLLAGWVRASKVRVVGARYDLNTGAVEVTDDS